MRHVSFYAYACTFMYYHFSWTKCCYIPIHVSTCTSNSFGYHTSFFIILLQKQSSPLNTESSISIRFKVEGSLFLAPIKKSHFYTKIYKVVVVVSTSGIFKLPRYISFLFIGYMLLQIQLFLISFIIVSLYVIILKFKQTTKFS